jgi:Cys-rich repeat protein
MKTSINFLASFLFATTIGACTDSDTSTVERRTKGDTVVIDVRCSADADCPAGFECESEVEHGTTTSFCKAHGGGSAGTGTAGVDCVTDADCQAGLECEVENEHGHVTSTCEAHGGRGNNGGGCSTNADCEPGFECEIEVEHGQPTSSCKAHGGH